MKKRYARICYDKHFMIHDDAPSPCYHGKEIDGLSLYFKYKYFVTLRQSNEEIEILFPKDGSIQPPCMYNCDYDMTEGYRMELRDTLLSSTLYSKVEYIPDKGYVWFKGVSEPQMIPFQTAVELLKNNPQSFNNSTNVNAQNLAYSMSIVDKGK